MNLRDAYVRVLALAHQGMDDNYEAAQADGRLDEPAHIDDMDKDRDALRTLEQELARMDTGKGVSGE